MAMATDKGAQVEPDCEDSERPSPLTSLITTLKNTAKNTGPSTVIPLLLTVLLMSARSDVPVAAGQDKYRPRILQVLKEVAPEVDPELILQQLSRMETDDLVYCSVEVAGKYRELEEENENYRKRKDAFVTLYQKEEDRVRELEAKLVEAQQEMDGMRGKHRSELDQIRQGYLNEKRRLEEECAQLRVHLAHLKALTTVREKDKQFKLDKREDFGSKVNGEDIQLRKDNQRYRVGSEKTTVTELSKRNTKEDEERVYNDASFYTSFYGNNTLSDELHQDYANNVSYYDNNTQGLTYCWELSAVANFQPTVANGWHNQFISMEITDGKDLPPPVEECGCMNESGLVEDSGYEDQLPIQETGHSDTQETVTGKNSS